MVIDYALNQQHSNNDSFTPTYKPINTSFSKYVLKLSQEKKTFM